MALSSQHFLCSITNTKEACVTRNNVVATREETGQHQLKEVTESKGKEDTATLTSDDADDAAEESWL
eukprot:scaffold113_cov55-Cylindrotheca_fusiformis.AAC.2